jgi:hypothetical protein
MMVGMVDDRAMRFRQEYRAPVPSPTTPRQPRPTPQPVAPALTPGDRFWGATFNPRSGFQAGTKPMSETAQQAQALTSFLNPLATVTEKALSGETPRFSDYAIDAGLLATGFIPFAGPGLRAGGQAARSGARPALETGEAIAARRGAIERLLNKEGPEAINEFLNFPKTAYSNYLNKPLLAKFFAETSERVPAGLQLHRVPSRGEVLERLPREIGAEYIPGKVTSTGGTGDMQRLGEILKPRSQFDTTGGGQHYAPGWAMINVRENLPGIANINEFLARYPSAGLASRGGRGQSTFNMESVLGPQTRFVVSDFRPGVDGGYPNWILDAFAR